MARTTITRTSIDEGTGLNLTDATFSTLSTGAGNGVEIPYRENDLLVLKNDTGGAAVFTIDIPQPAAYGDKDVTVPDIALTVATAKTLLYPLSSVLKQTDGDVYVDCDVAGKVIMLAI